MKKQASKNAKTISTIMNVSIMLLDMRLIDRDRKMKG